MELRPMTSTTKYFPAYEISKEKALKIQAFKGFKPMTKVVQLFKYQRRKPNKFRLS